MPFGKRCVGVPHLGVQSRLIHHCYTNAVHLCCFQLWKGELEAEKSGELKNWRIWYKIGQLEVLSVHDLLPHPATAGEITQ